jgi:hypothetical protein
MVPEVPSSLDSGVQFETAAPSPVSTPQVLPELLDPPVGSALDATGNVFTPEIIITPKKTQLLVEAVYVPPEPTPPSALPTPPVSNDEAVASDGDLTLDSTTSVHPPTPTLPSPTPPSQASNAPTPNIVTPPEHAPRPVEVVHLLPVQPVQTRLEPQVSAPRVAEPAPAVSLAVPKSDVAASRKLSLTSKPAPEVVRPPVQPVQSCPEPQALTPPIVIKPTPSSSATFLSAPVAALRKLSLTSKSAPRPVEPVRPTVQPVQSRPEPQVLAPPVIKSAPSSSATVPSATVTAPRKLSLTSKLPEPQQDQVQAVRLPVQPVQSHPEPQVLPPSVIKSAPSSSATVPSTLVAASRKLSLISKQPEPVQVQAVRPPVQPVQVQVFASPITKPAPEPIEAVRPPVQHVQSHPEPQVLAPPLIKSAPSNTATVPVAAAPRKLSLTAKLPEPQQVQTVRPVQVQVSAPPITKPAPASSATVPIAPVSTLHKPTLSSKPEPQQVEVVRPPAQPVLAQPVPQVSTPPVIKPAVASGAAVPSAPKNDVPASLKPALAPKPAPEPVETVRPLVQPVQAQPQISAPPVIKPAPSSSATVASVHVAVSHNFTQSSKPVPKQAETVRPPAQPVQAQPVPQVSVPPVVKPTPSSSATVLTAPKSDVPVPSKPTVASRSAPEQVEVARPPVQPAQAHPVPQVSSPPVIKPVPSRSAAAPSAPEHVRPRVEPVPSPNLPARIPETSTPPLHSNPATTSRAAALERVSVVPESARPRLETVQRPVAPAPDRVSAVPESARSRVETVYRSVPPIPAHQYLTSSTGGRPAPAAIASTPGKTIPAPDRTRSLATEAIRTPAQHSRPVGNVSATERTALTPSGTRSQPAVVPRPVQVARHTPGSSAVPVRQGPVPAGSVPSPTKIRLPPQHTRSQVGAGRTLASHAPSASRVPPLGSTPAGNAPVPEVSRRIKSHPRKMVTTVGQRRSVVMPPPPVMQSIALPPEMPTSTPVQQPSTRLAPQNSSLPPQGVSTRMSSISPLPEAQDKPKIRTAPTPAPVVPTAPSAAPPATPLAAAPPTRVDDITRAPTPTLRERASRLSIADGPTTGRSRRPTIVAEPETPRRAVRASVLSPMNPEQSATGPAPNRSTSSTPVARHERASVVLPDTSTQKRADLASIPGGCGS